MRYLFICFYMYIQFIIIFILKNTFFDFCILIYFFPFLFSGYFLFTFCDFVLPLLHFCLHFIFFFNISLLQYQASFSRLL